VLEGDRRKKTEIGEKRREMKERDTQEGREKI
jgi:hypothetical protein